MVSKKYWEKPIADFIKLVKANKEIRSVEVLGIPFQVFPGVFSPVYSSDTAWFAQKIIPLVRGKTFLEIGSGTGVIACLAAMKGAVHVTATDINPSAIKNIRLNKKMHSLDVTVKKGSVFDPIEKKEIFDVIFWNHPFYCSDNFGEEKDVLMKSVHDNKYLYLKEFFAKGKLHLNQNGSLILGTSNVARINEIKKIAKYHGYKCSLIEKTYVPIYKGRKVKMDLRLYEFVIKA